MLDNKTILITGGTGSFGKTMMKYLLNNTNIGKIIIFSRDEEKQDAIRNDFNNEKLKFVIDRELTSIQELLDRHSGKIKIENYYYAKDEKGYRKEPPPMIGDTHILIDDINNIPDRYIQFNNDDHHH